MFDSTINPEITIVTGRRRPRTAGRVRRPAGLSVEQAATLAEILAEPSDYIESPEFRKSGAERRIFDLAPEINRPDVSWYRPLMDDIGRREQRVRPNRSVVLTGAQERILFLKLNYARYRIGRIQRKLGTAAPDLVTSRDLLAWHAKAEEVREQLAETNLPLVLAMAKRVRINENEFPDLISEGNMALLRSVDKFDCGRGFKFSTYACRAILKAFSRHGIKSTKYRQRFPVEFDPELERSNHPSEQRTTQDREAAAEAKHLVLSNAAALSEIERRVIALRFAIDQPMGSQPVTLEQAGNVIGVTKERVRQIQNNALEKVRLALEGLTPDGDEAGTPARTTSN